MPTNITKARLEEFISALEKMGGSSGNKSLRKNLSWDEEFYWRVQGQLIKEGRISPGRGHGSSVSFTEAQAAASAQVTIGSKTTQRSSLEIAKERNLYAPLKKAIEGKWINKFGFDEVHIEETHSRGSKDTGGTFTRSDITAAGIRRYVYLPKRLEIVTFEIKPAESISIMGVLEAIAHREASHRSCVIYTASRTVVDAAIEAERISDPGQKYGIGIVLAERPDNVESWEIVLDAIRHEPYPARLDRFLGDLPSEGMKKQLSKWNE